MSKGIEVKDRLKLHRSNSYMFQVVKCDGYMKRIRDGKYIWKSNEYSDVYYYIDENAPEREREVKPEEWGGGNEFIKTYYEQTEKKFMGVVIGMKLITVKAELFCDSTCRADGVEIDYVAKHDIEKKKVAVVAYGCNKTRLVPLDKMRIVIKVEEGKEL